MSVDLGAIRTQIAAVLSSTGAFNLVDAYERRDRNQADMPLAQVWRPEATSPGVDQPQPEFGRYGYSFTWNLRCWFAMDDDEASQAQSDALTMQLFAAFNDPANQLAVSGLVDSWALQRVEVIPVLDVERPVVLLEGTLVTETTG